MPQIIVTAGDETVTLRERINASDFESERFAANLVERLAWAVSDATDAEVEPRPRREHPSDDVAEAKAPRELVEA